MAGRTSTRRSLTCRRGGPLIAGQPALQREHLAPGERPRRDAVGDRVRQELARLQVAVLEGPTAHAFGTPLRTIKRVRALIEREFGVRYSEVHVAPARAVGLFQPEARSARPGARRGRHRALEDAHLAAAQEKPAAGED
jgi:hypothetical protein